jgi:hypothetical protein
MTSFDTTALDLYLVGVLALAAIAVLLSLVTVATVLARGRRAVRARDVLRVEGYRQRVV